MANEIDKILNEGPREKKNRLNFYKEFINDKEKIKNVRTAIMVSIPFVMAIIYWGFLDNFNWYGADWQTIGALGFIASVGIGSAKKDSTLRSKDDAMTFDEGLSAIEKEINNMEFSLEDDDRILDILEKYNDALQERANKIKTQERKTELRILRRVELQKGNNVSKIDKELEFLEKNDLIDTNVEPFSYNDIILKVNKKQKGNQIVDAKFTRYDSAEYNKFVSFGFTLLKGVGLGGIGVGVAWTAGLWVVLGFFFGLIFSMGGTYLLSYIVVRYRTLGRYFEGRKEKLKLMRYVQSKLKEAKNEIPMEN